MERVGPCVLRSEMSLGEEKRDDWVKRLEKTCWEYRLGLGEQGKECSTLNYGRRDRWWREVTRGKAEQFLKKK